MGDIQEPIVEVLVASEAVGGQIKMVHPNLSSDVERNQVVALRRVVQLQVAEDDVGNFLEDEATTSQTCS